MKSNKEKTIGIVGGGPAGTIAAIIASENKNNNIIIFDKKEMLTTILPTGGGRCNLAYGEFDFKELAKYYPRGEKFLLSVFSRFSTLDTISFFEKIGIKTYMQDDFRFFPESNSSSEVREKLLKQLNKPNIKIITNKVHDIKTDNKNFVIKTQKDIFRVDKLVIATGGKGTGQSFAQKLGHKTIQLRPSLCALKTLEKDFFDISGLSLKNVKCKVFFKDKKILEDCGDILFTHFGVSGPLIYKISSYCAFLNFNKNSLLNLKLNFTNKNKESLEYSFQNELNINYKKDVINAITKYIPYSLAEKILKRNKIQKNIKCGQIKKEDRIKIVNDLTELNLNVFDVQNGEEIVTAGGVDLKEVDSKTMESKIVNDLYFCGEVLNIDGLTGGFNLQNCWSTGFITGISLKTKESPE